MDYTIIAIVCFAGGAFAAFIALEFKRKQVGRLRSEQEVLVQTGAEQLSQIRRESELVAWEVSQFETKRQAFETQVISYEELRGENLLLKADLKNIAISLRKLQLDRDAQNKAQGQIVRKVDDVGGLYLKDSVKWIGKSLNANNFSQSKQKLLDSIRRCRDMGLDVTAEEEARFVDDLRAEYELAVRAQIEREEQARIRAQIREEQKFEREVQREQARLERERAVLQEALARALATAADEHSAEIESLKARLAEAEEKERAISQAQLTKAGFVYVISNIGSFGEGVFKIGMTRRLEPQDRVRELGDASVPFPFDVHMMISCQNAPSLETALHRELFKAQVNKTNPRKEFFRTDVESIVRIVREHHGEVHYVADAEALQYRQSLTMSDEDQEFIEQVFDKVEDEADSPDGDVSYPTIST